MAGLGDMILTLSAVSPLKREYPESQIYFLTNRAMCEFLKCFKFINDTIEYRRGLKSNLQTIKQIRELNIDTIINFELSVNKSVIGLFSGAKRRIGFNSIALFPFLTDRVRDFRMNRKIHMRERYSCLTRPLGLKGYDILLPFVSDVKSTKRIDAFFAEKNITPNDILVGINPVTGFESKYWENKRWAEVADYLIEKKQARVIITYGPELGQEALARDIVSMMGKKAVLSFKTNITEFCTLVKRFKLFLCLDSGPFHFAVSQGIPTISLWGRGNLDQWGPQLDEHIVITKNVSCSPCNLFRCNSMICMKEIHVDNVLEKIEEWWGLNFRDG